MSQINATFVATICAAAVGKRLTLESLKEFALMEGLDAFLQLQEAGRAWFAEQFAHKVQPGRESLAYMQKDKVPGASTFYTYTQGIVRLLKAGKIAEIADLTTAQLSGKTAKNASAKIATERKEAPTAPAFTIADALQAILTAHSVGALTAEQYETLATIKPAAVETKPADVVEMPALRIAA